MHIIAFSMMHFTSALGDAWGSGLGYQKSLIIKILALLSVNDKAIFTKISTFQNLWLIR